MGLDIVTLGEVMVQFNPLTPGPLRTVKYFEVHVAGAEANTLVGLVRLGLKGGIITRVGNDEFGLLIINTLRSEGIDTSHVVIDDKAPTGIYFVQRHYPVPGKSTVLYYRHGSAASRLNETDIDEDFIKSSSILYLTGITPALSTSCLRAFDKAFRIALLAGVDVVFDTNLRIKLWRSIDRAREILTKYLKAKIIFTNAEDISLLFPNLSFEEFAKKVISKGADVVVIKEGAKGAVAYDKRGRKYFSKAFNVPLIEDVIGAGDAFNAAFLASYYRGLSIEEALINANAAGALAITVRGDIEALPRWSDLKLFVKSVKKELLLR